MRGVTKASLRQKTTNNIPTYVVTKGAFLTQLDRIIYLVYQYMVIDPTVRNNEKERATNEDQNSGVERWEKTDVKNTRR